MPRDGSNIYHYPVGIEGEPNQTIQSAPYNSFLSDVEQDLNVARPILAGGTGATNAAAALANLSGEQARQVVTNYDSFVFVAGSFYSLAGATGAPNSNGFRGLCVVTDNANMHIQARDTVTGAEYIRYKISGTWGAWSDINAFLDTKKVNRAGDTMTGNLTITTPTWPALILNKATTGSGSILQGYTNGVVRWQIALGDQTDDFSVSRYSDVGTFLGSPFTINRVTGSATFGPLTSSGNIIANQDIHSGASNSAIGTYYFGSGTSKYLTFDNTNFIFNGGQLIVNSLYSKMPTGGMSLVLQNSTTGFIKYHHVNALGTLEWINNANSIVIASLSDGGDFSAVGQIQAVGYRCRAGTSAGSYTPNNFNINHSTGQQLWIDSTNQGTIAYTSDYRTKKDVADLPRTWDMIKALRPIKYSHKDFTPPVEQEACTKRGEPYLKGDDAEQWGFIAHELQETLIESASSGVKDAPDTIQSPNPWTIIAALTKTLQEAMTRIEILEAR